MDFSEPYLTQVFRNRISNGYEKAINGVSENSDIFDVVYIEKDGFSMRYYNQKIMLPKFRNFVVESASFAFHLEVIVRHLHYYNYTPNWKYFGLFHRYKYNGSSIQNKVRLFLRRYKNSRNLSIRARINSSDFGLSTCVCPSSGCKLKSR